MKKPLRWLAALTALLLPIVAMAQQKGLEIDIIGGNASALPITVVPMPYQGSAGAPATDVAAVVRSDLDRSGQFRALPEAQIVERPTRGSEVQYPTWRALKQDYLVVGRVLDATLPLTPPEWPEWGNPIASQEDYLTIACYSPYDNVGALDYPPILALAGLTDPRVTYWEPAKWVAKLRERKTGDNPVLLKINMDAGHAGASGRFSRLEEVAFTYAFALKVTGKAGTA